MNEDWMDEAACRGNADPDRFVPESPIAGPPAECGRCPVVALCRAYGQREKLEGWWGGKYRRPELADELDIRFELHGQGKTDREIAELVGVQVPAVIKWRGRNDLPPNSPPRDLEAEEQAEAERRELYEQGAPDRVMAEILGIAEVTVRRWRGMHSLPINSERPRIDAERMALYEQGLTDIEMATALGMTRTGVSNWRERHNLERNVAVLEMAA